MAFRFSLPHISTLDANGDPVSGAKANFYESGTTTRLDTYSNEALTNLNANPVVADSAGKWGDIWLQSADYKVIITDSADVVITTMDPVQGNPSVAGDDFKVSQQSPADMTVLVSKGALFDLTTKTRVPKAEQTSTAITAPSADPKIDVIYVDRLSGVIGIAAGAEAASPVVPAIPDGKLPLAEIALAITTTEITDNLITDIRELANIGTGSAAAKNTGAAAGNVPTNDQAFTDVASATTTDIGAATSLNVRITGTTTITGLGTVAAGIRRKIRFAAALTLTHNATSLILPGSANISTAANDTAEFISLGSGNWLCNSYKRADGTPISGGSPIVTEYTSNDTHTWDADMVRFRIEGVSGGAEGGDGSGGTTSATGGGGGGPLDYEGDASEVGATSAVVIGAGGTGGTTTGNDGGDTSIALTDRTLSAQGGIGGGPGTFDAAQGRGGHGIGGVDQPDDTAYGQMTAAENTAGKTGIYSGGSGGDSTSGVGLKGGDSLNGGAGGGSSATGASAQPAQAVGKFGLGGIQTAAPDANSGGGGASGNGVTVPQDGADGFLRIIEYL